MVIVIDCSNNLDCIRHDALRIDIKRWYILPVVFPCSLYYKAKCCLPCGSRWWPLRAAAPLIQIHARFGFENGIFRESLQDPPESGEQNPWVSAAFSSRLDVGQGCNSLPRLWLDPRGCQIGVMDIFQQHVALVLVEGKGRCLYQAWCTNRTNGLGVFCSRNGAFPSLRIIFPGFVFSVSGFGFLFLDLGFWFPAVFFVPLPVLFLPAVSSLLQAIRLGGEIS